MDLRLGRGRKRGVKIAFVPAGVKGVVLAGGIVPRDPTMLGAGEAAVVSVRGGADLGGGGSDVIGINYKWVGCDVWGCVGGDVDNIVVRM
jgi:hypothetical protein